MEGDYIKLPLVAGFTEVASQSSPLSATWERGASSEQEWIHAEAVEKGLILNLAFLMLVRIN